MTDDIFERDLPRTAANHAALTPLSFLARAAGVYPDEVAVVHGDLRRTYAALDARCRRLASALAARGVGRGDAVTLMAPNVPEMLEAHYGVPLGGATLNALNYRLDAATIAFILEHAENTAAMLEHLSNHPQVSWVSHPDLPAHTSHELAKKYLPKGAGSIVSFGVKGGRDAGKAFIENVQLASHLANVGDAKTLIIHPATTTHSRIDGEALVAAGITEDMIRLSVGLEDVADIKADFENGFRAARRFADD